MNETEFAIGVTSLEPHVKGESLEERVKATFRACDGRTLWFTTSPDVRFKCGIGAVMASYESAAEERKVIKKSLKALEALNALCSGVPVDIDRIDTENTVPLASWWREIWPES